MCCWRWTSNPELNSYVGQNGWIRFRLVSGGPLPLYCVSVGVCCSEFGDRVDLPLCKVQRLQQLSFLLSLPAQKHSILRCTILVYYHCVCFAPWVDRGLDALNVHIDPARSACVPPLLIWTHYIMLFLSLFIM